MTATLTQSGYEQTKAKLAKLEDRLARLADHSGLSDQHVLEARRSFEKMIGQYRREIKLYEAAHPEQVAKK